MQTTSRVLPVVGCLIGFWLTTETVMADDVVLPEHAPAPQLRESALERRLEASSTSLNREIPAREQACRKELRALGVAFAAVPPIDGEGGCALPFPVEVSSLSPTIRLQPEAILNCVTARATARLFQKAGTKSARKHLDAEIAAVRHSSAYVCRPINGNTNLSEHAFGNALDIAGITLAGGREIAVKHYDNANGPEAKFFKDVRAAACGLFTTVLGPGTNADHAEHFHFDMKRRRAPYCR